MLKLGTLFWFVTFTLALYDVVSRIEMGTLLLKHIVTEKIGKNVGNFKLPSVATFVVKELVEKCGASMLEDTT